MLTKRWNEEELLKLYKLCAIQKKTYHEVGKILGTSANSCRKKFKTTNWDLYLKNPSKVAKNAKAKLWSVNEKIQLYALRNKEDLEFAEIAQKMGRTYESVEAKYRRVNWKKFLKDKGINYKEATDTSKNAQQVKDELAELERNELARQLSFGMIELARHNINRLEEITLAHLVKKTKTKKSQLPETFEQIKERARTILEEQGYCYPDQESFGEGTYVIFGDSHGKHTKRNMFKLINNINKEINPDKIIHIGHILDDDNDISYLWENFDNFVILAKQEEIKTLREKEFDYSVVRNEIKLGELSICNQDLIQDYVTRHIGSISPQIFPDSVVINCHRHEFNTRTTDEGFACIASPGCLCERHIVKTIKQMDFTDGLQVKLSYPEGYIKYRRMKQLYKYWEQGFLVVHVHKDGKYSIVPCRIKKTKRGYTTSYGDKIITESRVMNPHKKIFVNADTHCPSHSKKILSIQNQFCQDYKPDIYVNLGDQNNVETLNHHEMSRNGLAINKSILRESAYNHFILSKSSSWADEKYYILGNHERFKKDFTGKMPQFDDLLENSFILNTECLGVQLVGLKEVLKKNGVNFIHGDFKQFGQSGGSKIEKSANTFGKNTVMGDVHYPAIRFGCYSVPMTGELDQGYNEVNASKWGQGFAFINLFEGEPFISIVNIPFDKVKVSDKFYSSKNEEEWEMKDFDASISYSFQK